MRDRTYLFGAMPQPLSLERGRAVRRRRRDDYDDDDDDDDYDHDDVMAVIETVIVMALAPSVLACVLNLQRVS